MKLEPTKSAARRSAFTLMEMLVVVAILVVLAGAAVPIYMRYLNEAKKDRARIDVKTLTEIVESYRIKYNDYPATLGALAQPGPNGGDKFADQRSLLDPWGHEYQYAQPGTHNTDSEKPDIWSLGPKANDPTGIIGNWSDAPPAQAGN
ncbi:MAG TPA: type II secretion system protein GspG [Gemmataceae bacterium]|nr:type II secretion system protein GspG [Gemmataceae bacterium]